MVRDIKNLSDAITQYANWLDIMTMNSDHNQSLHNFQQKCFKEMSESIAESDSKFITSLMIRLTEKGKLCPLEILKGKSKK